MGNYIYGMGRNGIRLYLLMKKNKISINAFVDRDSQKQVRCFDGVKCISIDEYKKQVRDIDLLIVSINDEIVEKLHEDGISNCVSSKDYIALLDEKFVPLKTVEDVKEKYNDLLRKRKL